MRWEYRRLVSAPSGALFLLLASAHGLGAQTPRAAAETRSPTNPPGIQDNSFLIEEAYNQEPGVVQHILNFEHDERSATFGFLFTQEWPLGGVTHQFSYVVPLMQPEDSKSPGVGDIRLNYRYQLVGGGESAVAMAPRLTVVLPTGDYRQGRGTGALGAEAWLPVSVETSKNVVLHGNVGLTLTPHARNIDGARSTTRQWTLGGSVVWLAHPRINFLLEALYQRGESIAGAGVTEWGSDATLSPGVRWAYNFASGLQIVPGVAFPLGVGPSHGQRSLFFYLSFEHAFRNVPNVRNRQ